MESVHTLILGAGPSGLAAGYKLAKAGRQPVVLERDKVCGGLMRSIKYDGFTVDLGRKELYNRIARVDELWSEILGPDYRTYSHRGGILYQGRIIDMSLSGAAIAAENRPPLKSLVLLGKIQARVVRNLEEGFALEFVHEQLAETLEDAITSR